MTADLADINEFLGETGVPLRMAPVRLLSRFQRAQLWKQAQVPALLPRGGHRGDDNLCTNHLPPGADTGFSGGLLTHLFLFIFICTMYNVHIYIC